MSMPILSEFRPMFDPPSRQDVRAASAACLRERATAIEDGAHPRIADWSELAREERTRADQIAMALAQTIYGVPVPEDLPREECRRLHDAALTATRMIFSAWNTVAFQRAMDALLASEEDFGGAFSALLRSVRPEVRQHIAFTAVKVVAASLLNTYASPTSLDPADYLRTIAAVTEAGGRL